MSRLRKFCSLSREDRRGLCHAAVLLMAADIAVRLFSAHRLMKWMEKPRRHRHAMTQGCPDRMAWLVELASRNRWPRPNCLRKSLALWALLRRSGWEARLVIGAKSSARHFQAHAWVELDGRTLGSEDPGHYQELVSFRPIGIEHLPGGQKIA